jgi:hypothetical protein
VHFVHIPHTSKDPIIFVMWVSKTHAVARLFGAIVRRVALA